MCSSRSVGLEMVSLATLAPLVPDSFRSRGLSSSFTIPGQDLIVHNNVSPAPSNSFRWDLSNLSNLSNLSYRYSPQLLRRDLSNRTYRPSRDARFRGNGKDSCRLHPCQYALIVVVESGAPPPVRRSPLGHANMAHAYGARSLSVLVGCVRRL